MGQRRECIHRFAVEQDVQFHQFRRAETDGVVVERSIALRDRFQFVVEVDHDFGQRHVVMEFHSVARYIFLLDQFAAFAQAEGHDVADEVGAGDDRSTDIRFFDVIDFHRVGHSRGVVHFEQRVVLIVNVVAHVRHRGDHIHVELSVQSFLHDLHVQQAQESAAETEAQCHRRFGLEGE